MRHGGLGTDRTEKSGEFCGLVKLIIIGIFKDFKSVWALKRSCITRQRRPLHPDPRDRWNSMARLSTVYRSRRHSLIELCLALDIRSRPIRPPPAGRSFQQTTAAASALSVCSRPLRSPPAVITTLSTSDPPHLLGARPWLLPDLPRVGAPARQFTADTPVPTPKNLEEREFPTARTAQEAWWMHFLSGSGVGGLGCICVWMVRKCGRLRIGDGQIITLSLSLTLSREVVLSGCVIYQGWMGNQKGSRWIGCFLQIADGYHWFMVLAAWQFRLFMLASY